jgi:hypothetical protein
VLSIACASATPPRRNRQEWDTNAPAKDSGFAVANPSAFCVMEAGDKGNGLFATEYVPKGTYLFDYTGKLLSKLEYDVRYPNRVSDYCAALRDPATGTMHFVDGKDEELGHPSRWMNHDDRKPNVGRRSFFPADGSQPRILMYALDDLFLGDELQWNCTRRASSSTAHCSPQVRGSRVRVVGSRFPHRRRRILAGARGSGHEEG